MKGQRVLEVGCGTGNLAVRLAAAGCRVTGVDSSATMLTFAREKGIPAEFQELDATKLPYDREFDAAVISLALHEMAPAVRIQIWEAMGRALQPGGRRVALDFARPQHNSLLARGMGSLIEQDERGTLRYHPEHYRNYPEFMQAGGLLS